MSLAPATRPRPRPDDDGLLVLDAAEREVTATRFGSLGEHLSRGDLLVVNDAATLPASLEGTTAGGARIELRLMGEVDDGLYTAVSFGEGDHRTRTEDRDPGPHHRSGNALAFGRGLAAVVTGVDPEIPRLVRVRLTSTAPRVPLLHALATAGKPVQYAHVPERLALWDVQTIFASRPWAVEIPSAGRPFTHGLVAELLRRGVGLAHLTHAAGLTSTGDPALDARLPLPEKSDIPDETARAIRETRGAGGRVIAVGTSVTRALESSWSMHGEVRHGTFVSTWKGEARTSLQVVDGIVTGMHAPPESHHELLRAFADDDLLARAAAVAEARGFLAHELGDSMLILSPRRRTRAAAPRAGSGRPSPVS